MGSSVGEKMSVLCEESTYHSCEFQVDAINSFVTKPFTEVDKFNLYFYENVCKLGDGSLDHKLLVALIVAFYI